MMIRMGENFFDLRALIANVMVQMILRYAELENSKNFARNTLCTPGEIAKCRTKVLKKKPGHTKYFVKMNVSEILKICNTPFYIRS